MTEVQTPTQSSAVAGGKRKRTGKQREEAKKAAQAKALLGEVEEELPTTITAAEAVQAAEEVTEARPQDDEEIPGNITEPAEPEFDVAKVENRVPQALKTLHPIFKQAKTFETQRLIKKIKFLRTKSEASVEVTDLEAQLTLLTHLQISVVAQTHLLLKLRKRPQFRQTAPPSPIIDLLTPTTPSISASSSSSTPALVTKVENRLCSSKTVAEGMKSVLAWLIGEQGAVLGSRAATSKRKKEVGEARKKMEDARQMRMVAMQSLKNESDEEDLNQGDEVILGGEREEMDEEMDEEDRAAEAAGWESGSVGGDSEDENDLGEIEQSDEEGSESDKSNVPPTKRNKPTPQPKIKAKPLPRAPPTAGNNITSSMFLPTLATGFTAGDSDGSDPDDDYDADGIIGSSKGERKNRRGQRARQAIWEKKYGKNAKHVVKAQQEEFTQTSGGTGWGSKGGRNAVPAEKTEDVAVRPPVRGVDSGRGRGRGAFSSAPSSRPAPAYSAPPAADTGEKALHPSWEAAKLRKQKQLEVGGPKATKIVFD